jgi:hypothetical protein
LMRPEKTAMALGPQVLWVLLHLGPQVLWALLHHGPPAAGLPWDPLLPEPLARIHQVITLSHASHALLLHKG